MARSLPRASLEDSTSKPIVELRELLEKRAAPMKQLQDAESEKERRIKEADKLYAAEVGDAPEQLAAIDKQIGKLVSHHRSWISQRFTQTLKFGESVVEIRFPPREAVIPQNKARKERALRWAYELFGDRYVAVKLEPKAKAIAEAPQEDLDDLRQFGLGSRTPFAVRVKSPTEKKTTTIFKRTYKRH